MSRWFIAVGMVLSLSAGFALSAPGDKKDNKNDPPPPADADALPAGQFIGKLKTLPSTDGSFVVDLQYQRLELKNPNQAPNAQNTNPQLQQLNRDQQKITRLQNQLANARTQQQQTRILQQLQNAMNSYQQHQVQAALTPQQSPYQVKNDHKEFTFHASEDMKVRFSKPPASFDDKGNFKELKDYTADELKALKGTGDDAKLDGYMGSADKLAVGMQVRVTTVRNKPKKEEKPKEAADGDKKDNVEKKADADKKDNVEKKADADKKDPADPDKKDMGPKTLVKVILVIGDDSSGDNANGGDNNKPKRKKNNNN